ncbi:hypothetical protein DDE18_12940 [Nocardioides gansuensis]|uniref:Aminoglycoside phosphotransferase domain-containing protein n=1 Tax=Nocardioides gansuensis TaxID=2138300 RepID=A0A2T8F9L0_9ACTN|nr:phosphotransferase [Nocardioides gansuensis]PVG82380.1 hypothetical protein DDE18_12940 [Nocardioides gansuensis]
MTSTTHPVRTDRMGSDEDAGELETHVIHGDYSPYNVVVDEQSDNYVTGVFELGDTMRSAVIFDPRSSE